MAQMLTTTERAAVITGRVDYFDSSGVLLRGIDVTNDYYATNRGETFPVWVESRIGAGVLQISAWPPSREPVL
ncbi:hypothetical protein [Mycobacteroides abscessus]|uniref:hypothetical protein n=1 Tax=Mycobacteroides abscessus TaxID=36809 RepID=UPI00092C4A17|nr:hypothetical protein [Mycobacteroides abscessus]SHQ48116.1 Uncharacterised protein [Mycobacteroides abscessus subsp. abscessus]SKQ85629.1 Uncharacterised protein [Mycobacteroides abscessus subsp. massiliense]SLC48854.1 Uncharacterised protein [Mycobacteroides abscessus subsp. massiliense]